MRNGNSHFEEGRCYTRRQIADKLGGGLQDYLPHKNLHVVCGCFTKKLNPNAPHEVLPANTDDKRRWAQQFYDQQEAVPIFLKRATNEWEYRGLWRCESLVEDPKIIAQKERESLRRSVAMVLQLVKMPQSRLEKPRA